MTGLRASRGQQIVDFIESMCVHGEGDLEGMPAVLRDDQKVTVWRWAELDADGVWWYERMYYEAPKGDGKTMLFAWLVIAELFLHQLWNPGQRANIVVTANSRLQAGEKIDGNPGEGIFGRIVQVVEHQNFPLRDMVSVANDRVSLEDGSRVRLFPARAATVDGGLPTLFVADEVQDFGGQAAEAHQRNENSTTKRAGGRSMSCSTPGAQSGDPTVGWRLHNYGAKGGDDRFLFVCHAADRRWRVEADPVTGLAMYPDDVRAAIVEANVGASERKIERLCRRYSELPLSDFCRFHLGWWQDAGEDSWLAQRPEAWARCAAPGVTLSPGQAVWAGVDMSLRNDMSAVVWCGLVGDRWVVRSRVFTPGPNGKVDASDVVACITELDELYELVGVSYDPRLFEMAASSLSDGGVRMVEQPQSPERMIPKCQHAFNLVLDGVVAHDGDLVLAHHVNSAVKRIYPNGWTLSKDKSGQRKIDGCIAMILALHLAATLDPVAEVEEPWVFAR